MDCPNNKPLEFDVSQTELEEDFIDTVDITSKDILIVVDTVYEGGVDDDTTTSRPTRDGKTTGEASSIL